MGGAQHRERPGWAGTAGSHPGLFLDEGGQASEPERSRGWPWHQLFSIGVMCTSLMVTVIPATVRSVFRARVSWMASRNCSAASGMLLRQMMVASTSTVTGSSNTVTSPIRALRADEDPVHHVARGTNETAHGTFGDHQLGMKGRQPGTESAARPGTPRRCSATATSSRRHRGVLPTLPLPRGMSPLGFSTATGPPMRSGTTGRYRSPDPGGSSRHPDSRTDHRPCTRRDLPVPKRKQRRRGHHCPGDALWRGQG